MPRSTPAQLRERGYVQADLDKVPTEGQSLFRSKRADYRIDERGCWIWIKSLSPAGYASDHGHRKYWRRANGPIPDGAEVHHRCRVVACVNPDHLEAIHPRTHDVIHFLGERAGGLSVSDVAEIKRLGLLPGASAQEVAARFGIHRFTVHRYWNAERWTPETGGEPVETPRRICALEECDNVCEGNRHRRYCCELHRSRAGDRRRRAGIYSPGGSNGLFFAADVAQLGREGQSA